MQSALQNISVVIAVSTVAIVALILLSVMRRISSILKAIMTVREGEYTYRVRISGNDELALLGDEFNRLMDRLHATEEIRRKFVANASHELKTPLASIRLLSDSILQSERIERETELEFVSDIGVEAERLARITEKLMSLAKLDMQTSDENTIVDVKNTVVATLRMLEPLAHSNGLSIMSYLDEGCLVFATEDSLHQVVFNLVENAIKYNRPNGRVAVTLRTEGDEVVLTVDNTGVSVPDADMPHIFDRFYRVDKARSREAGGSGLGLSIVRDTVRDLKGTVSAERLYGGGMRFQVRFAKC
jgi:signal transduction histidine kinase